MAMPPNKSSSPMIAGRTSPKNSEIGNPLRRSFSGNPFAKPSIVPNPRSLNPVTPANSPSDYPRRNSVSREILFTSRDTEEKENGKDQNPKHIRVRSPTVGKSSKHFMSPTISAASKIAVSPKKKILGDRNESIRSSLSFCSTKTSSLNSVNPNPDSEAAATVVESDANPEIAPISTKSSRTVRFSGFEVISGSYDDAESTYRHDSNPVVTTMVVEADTKQEIAPISSSVIAAEPHKTSKTVRFSGVEVISASNNDFESPAKNVFTEELDCVNLDPSFKISPVSSPMVAPLDADPLMPPYDPKTNYLSPRSQFLHYRPNRRIERGNRLEEFFSSVNVSDSETEDSQKESDESSSDESEQGEEEEEEVEEQIHISSEQETIGVKKSTKSQCSRMFKISSLLLILSVTFFSICAVVRDPNILERSSLLIVEDPSEIYELGKMNFNVLVGKFEVWHANSISSISRLVSNLRGGAPSLIYLNQTEFLNKNVDDQCLVLSHQTSWEKEDHLNVMEEATKDRENGIESVERDEGEEDRENGIESVERDEGEEEEDEEPLQEIEAKNEEEEKLLHEIEAEANHPKDGEENDEISAKSASEESLDTEENDEISAKSAAKEEETVENYEVLSDFVEPSAKSASDTFDGDIIQENEIKENNEESSVDFETLDQTEPEAATEEENNYSNTEIQYQTSPPVSPFTESSNGGNIEIIRATIEEDHKISEYFSQNMMFVFGLLLSLIPLAGLIYARKSFSKPSMAAVEEQNQPFLKEKTTNQSPEEKEEEEEEEEEAAGDGNDDMTGESCSSETSSFQYSSMRSGGAEAVKESNEAQSHSHARKTRKNSRRESLASSSLDEYSNSASPSPSYGSYTTYQRIKHQGNGEEEIRTPVRRSSRIRKQHSNNNS